ncbi:efflux RND transporter permease subunit [Nitrospirillum viridazoti]|uniref:Efflux pump membrane transporter n=1 Tax=Nitrospirillum viridazoti CBAmc TaxID=1441467 RepID=A0A248K1Q5_9PROT|nr:efflux RND transporter permease subunit [Nitrospirillum amazonense]ASG24686.1 hydrophobe/amphiphile efflux-1 family RND transporter [Nitrospirillum amazonense CBAmc]TWB36943.1 multidrug efflux pump [Nitrospirillum amazonense]
MSKFFIDRPVFAWVIAIVIMMAGALAINTLPIEQFPRIAPPSVAITTTYPGASAKTLEDTVTQVIEQKMNGIDHLRYMSSTSDSSGNVTITLTFNPEADPDIAQVQVQNKLQLATPLLPTEVQQQGVQVSKATKNFLMVLAFYSPSGQLGETEIGDFVASNLQDPISRVDGVGDITLFGPQHAMRIWLDPNKLAAVQMTAADVTSAIGVQNKAISAGQVGGLPAVKGQQLNATIIAQTRLETPEEFSNIILRVNQDGSQVRLRDVARVELGSNNYEVAARFNGHPAAGLAIKLTTGANALQVEKAIIAKLDEMKPFFPEGLEVSYPYDTTPFVRLSIHDVVETLAEAVVLVFIVMFVFLQSWRATLIPTIAVPVVLLGTFGVLSACGFSINTLTMFAMVLAIGLLVDDAIVVVENVERVMAEEGLSPREATRKSMGQITGALVGIAMVLSAVFVPMAFFSGSTGAIYRQFSLTIVSAMGLSVLVALILTPALCATLLKPAAHHGGGGVESGPFGWFNRGFNRTSEAYGRAVGHVSRRTLRYLLVYGVIVVGLVLLFVRLPTAFLPDEDQGFLFVQASTPPGATAERTLAAAKAMEKHFLEDEKDNVKGLFTVVGFSFAGRGQNSAFAFVNLRDWSERSKPEQRASAIAQRAMMKLAAYRDASIYTLTPPAVLELGNATGFDFELVDRASLGHEKLMAARNQLLGMAAQNPILAQVRPNGLEDVPQLRVKVDQTKAEALGLSISDINTTLSTAWGSAYVNDFIDKGRVKKVYAQADAPFRMLPGDINRWYVRGSANQMVPFSTFTNAYWEYGSPQLERYNGVSSRDIQGVPAPGHTTGQAMAEMEKLAAKLPTGFGFEWTGLSYEERLAGSQAPALYGISLAIVFLCLAALYESWSIPFAVMLVVPLGVIGAVLAATLRGLSNDVYFQVGLLTTIGLAAKNAILIVEFAKEQYEAGHELIDAVTIAAKQRLRPILMTSFAFILGVLPLAVANGAGSGGQNAIGVGVMGGMLSATFLAIFFVPVFFVSVLRRFGKRPAPGTPASGTPAPATPGHDTAGHP